MYKVSKKLYVFTLLDKVFFFYFLVMGSDYLHVMK